MISQVNIELFELGIRKIRQAQEAGEIRSDLEPFFIIKILISLPMAWFQTLAETRSLIDSDIRPEALDEMYLRDMVKIILEGVRPRGDSSGEVRRPARVVAPTRVKGGSSSLMERAAGPSPIMMSS